MAAPIGNKNAVGQQDAERPFRDALNRAIKQENGKRVRQAAEKLLDLAADGEAWAIRELADRIDGKAMQAVEAKVDGFVTLALSNVDADL